MLPANLLMSRAMARLSGLGSVGAVKLALLAILDRLATPDSRVSLDTPALAEFPVTAASAVSLGTLDSRASAVTRDIQESVVTVVTLDSAVSLDSAERKPREGLVSLIRLGWSLQLLIKGALLWQSQEFLAQPSSPFCR